MNPEEVKCTCTKYDPYCCPIHGSCPICVEPETPEDAVLGYKTSIVAQMLDSNNKQETIEEAAEIFVNNRFTKQISGDKSYPDIYASKESIIESHILFAKWQAERMYSEQEVLRIIDSFEKLCYNYQSNKDWIQLKKSEWFKQVKK